MAKKKQKSIQPEKTPASKENLIRSIIGQFKLITGRPEQVKKDCQKLSHLFEAPLSDSAAAELEPLFNLLQKRSGPIAEHLFSFLEEIAGNSPDPSPFIKAILCARDKNLALRALEYAVQLNEKGILKVNRNFVQFLAGRMKLEKTHFAEADAILDILLLIRNYKPAVGFRFKDPLLALYLEEENMDLRRLAARLLDSSGKSVSPDVAKAILGKKSYEFFSSYLAYTRATHKDLLFIQPYPEFSTPLIEDLISAEKIIGKKLLYEVTAKLGWKRLNLGINVKALTGVTVDGSPLFMASEAEASLLEKCRGARRTHEKYLIIACGGQISEEQGREDKNDPITRFRSYNLNHAALLSYFLDVGPLNKKKVHEVVSRMDKIVQDYVALFSPFSDECAVLPELYGGIRDKIFAELDEDTDQPQLSADLTRLVQSFEDPQTLGEVRTLHGLKRYLHQQGLSLGFRLVEGGRSPNRSVDIVIATKGGILYVMDKIRYADFEEAAPDQPSIFKIPFSVQLLINGFARQMLYGNENFPHISIFCYGNEVHYYFGFRNHPAFLRIDFAPPLRGGMIDLEYFGVSNYELDHHPNISLDAIRIFFEKMEFDIRIDGTRIHARYDKERALNLGDLCRKARYVFRLAPYFMDLDWTIGSLTLEREARLKVAEAWSDFFLRWGFIPMKTILSKNRNGILTGFVDEPTGRMETVWSGEGEYKDIYSVLRPEGFLKDFLKVILNLGIESRLPALREYEKYFGQLELEEHALNPLRHSLERGELIRTAEGFQAQSADLFLRVHEAELFAELLSSGTKKIKSAIGIARLALPLERTITFNTTGSVNGYLVQSAILTLRAEELCFYVLRGADGMIHLAFFIHGRVLYKKRENKSAPWISNAVYDVSELAVLLRANDFVDTLSEPGGSDEEAQAAQFLNEIKQSILPLENAPLRGERIVSGLKASPGRTVGRALFGTEGRNPQDFQGAILVAASIRPEDTTSLYYADGIVSTGGGILSHAGLIAMQFRKPSLIIAGDWRDDSGGQRVLMYRSLAYNIKQKKISGFNLCIRTDVHERENALREGDLLILDALSGNMRVLGQERDVLALYEGFRLYRSANEMLATIKNEKEILNLRGKRLRARHQLENILRRCSDPLTARYAVFEILLNEPAAGTGMIHRDKGFLLSVLLGNQALAGDARDYLMLIMVELKSNIMETIRKAINEIPFYNCAYEVLSLRLDAIHQKRTVESAIAALKACEIKLPEHKETDWQDIEVLTIKRLFDIKKNMEREIKTLAKSKVSFMRMRHIMRKLERIERILGVERKKASFINRLQKQLVVKDDEARKSLADRYVIEHSNGGFELYRMIGWKAANLAEIERLIGKEVVPPWFAVTDKAFREALNTPLTESGAATGRMAEVGPTLREAINNILQKDDLNNLQKSMKIQNLWERIRLPDELRRTVIAAFKEIVHKARVEEAVKQKSDLVYVAVRSSSVEEDTESAARAGEFETYLYINGEDQLLYYLKRTWSGLWTERAIHNRAIMGGEHDFTGGGLIVQRIVNSRVSGVLQTVNIPKGNLKEIVINAGLGLGEGIVSGTVAADQITVTKESDSEKEPLRFSYITSDKTEQIVFNRHAGFGTVRSQTLYHQRLRPALEYVELCQLVRYAVSLENAYGYPLDIEFGIEGSRIWLLQARPVASFLSVINETLQRFPFKKISIHTS